MQQKSSDFQKIYFQLAPSAEARALLRTVAENIELASAQATFVDSDRWHLTVIHIGTLQIIWQQLNTRQTELTFELFEESMRSWARRQRRRVAGKSYTLLAKDLRFFGGSASVLALAFEAGSELRSDHKRAYNDLVETWTKLGVNQPAMTLRSLPEFKFAHSLTPHVTLARGVGVNVNLPDFAQDEVVFTPMKFFYQLHE